MAITFMPDPSAHQVRTSGAHHPGHATPHGLANLVDTILRTIRHTVNSTVVLADRRATSLVDANNEPMSGIEIPRDIVAKALRIECGHAAFKVLLTELVRNGVHDPWEQAMSFQGVTIYPCHWLKDGEWRLVNPFRKD